MSYIKTKLTKNELNKKTERENIFLFFIQMTNTAAWINEIIIVSTCSELDFRIDERLKETFNGFKEITKLRLFVDREGQSKSIRDKSPMLSSI